MNERVKEMTNNATVLNTHGQELRSMRDSVNNLGIRMNEVMEQNKEIRCAIGEMKKQLQEEFSQINEENAEFPVKKTLIAQNVWYRDDEDLNKVAVTLIHKALNLPNIKIVRTARKSGKNTGKGLVKIELETSDMVMEVLKCKQLLKQSEVAEIRDVYLQQLKREDILKMERNVDLILRDTGVRNDYIRLPLGHLVRKENYRGQPKGRGRGVYYTRGRG